jgi:endopeptidase La
MEFSVKLFAKETTDTDFLKYKDYFKNKLYFQIFTDQDNHKNFRIEYNNTQTNVSFTIEYDSNQQNLQTKDGYSSSGLTVTLGYVHPNFFAHETFTVLEDFAKIYELEVKINEEKTLQKFDRKSLIDAWIHSNNEYIQNNLDSVMKMDPLYMPEEKAFEWWNHIYTLDKDRSRLATIGIIPKMFLARKIGETKVHSIVIWNSFSPTIFPECDYIYIERPESPMNEPKRKQFGLITYWEFANKIRTYTKPIEGYSSGLFVTKAENQKEIEELFNSFEIMEPEAHMKVSSNRIIHTLLPALFPEDHNIKGVSEKEEEISLNDIVYDLPYRICFGRHVMPGTFRIMDPAYLNFLYEGLRGGNQYITVNANDSEGIDKRKHGYLVRINQTGIDVTANGGFTREFTKDSRDVLEFWLEGTKEVEVITYQSEQNRGTFRERIFKPLAVRSKTEILEVIEELYKKICSIVELIDREKYKEISAFVSGAYDLIDFQNIIFHFLHLHDLLTKEECYAYQDLDSYEERLILLKEFLQTSFERAKSNPLSYQNSKGKDIQKDKKGIDVYTEKIAALPISEGEKEELMRIAESMKVDGEGREYANNVMYLDTVLSIPWGLYTNDEYDLKVVKETLDRYEFGLEKVKQRILEYLAVEKRTKGDIKAPILCLVGPPGVGKTFFAKNLAKALKREYTSIAVGGMNDINLLKGEQKGYIGAASGLITRALIRAKTMNPIIVLDEIDKITNVWTGAQVIGALHEILDPNQNYEYMDYYVQLKMDLSKVFFITTANYWSQIPATLQDRLEMIEVESYTDKEKLEIAKNYMLPSLLTEHHLEKKSLSIGDDVWETLLKLHRMEPGMRMFNKSMSQIVRRSILTLEKTHKAKVSVTEKNLNEYWDQVYVEEPTIDATEELVGIVIGMSVIERSNITVGGKAERIEVNVFKGKGKLELTGSLGDVLKESVSVAKSYVRKHAAEFGIDEDFSGKTDISVHWPNMAIGKDGPSATVGITIALISALKNRPIRQNIAMTGEMDMEGNVLGIGGVKEKINGTYRMGIREFILPKVNEYMWDEVPDDIRNNVTVTFVSHINEVLKLYFPEIVLSSN